jgi:MoaA/NifB/PqqE/SkfB family radical SAM enzyme
LLEEAGKADVKLTHWLPSTYHVLDVKISRSMGLIPRGPFIVFLSLTERCNLRCKNYTIWKTNTAEEKAELSRSDFFSLFSQLASMGTKIVALWGGRAAAQQKPV